MEEKGYVDFKFIVFLKATLGKMVGTNVLHKDTVNYYFWESWSKKFYNIKSYDSSKEELSRSKSTGEDRGYGQDEALEQSTDSTERPSTQFDEELSPSILTVKFSQ